ncbi:MAG: DUF1549 domain-containing protein [Planctomycetota bacterium]
MVTIPLFAEPARKLLFISTLVWFGLYTLAFDLGASRASEKLTAEQQEFFETRIRPVLVEHCYECHNSTEESKSGLALDYRDGLREVLEEEDGFYSTESTLLQAMRHEIAGLEMPEGGPRLSDEVIADFDAWLKSGAPDPRDNPPSAKELSAITSWEAMREKRKQWWSFQPILAVSPPEVSQGEWRSPIDRFVLKRLMQEQLTPSKKADKKVLIRRLYYALIGLPPAAEEVAAYVADDSPEAYEKLVERLLESKHFGERWARHWMDWVRYAESHGSEGDPRLVGAELYRDYLIRALNEDVPYDQLLVEHVAGDLLPQPRINGELNINESLIGTAHWRMVFHGFAPTDALDEKVRFTDDAINAFSKAFLGLTVSCARCHNHKFDAISQARLWRKH